MSTREAHQDLEDGEHEDAALDHRDVGLGDRAEHVLTDPRDREDLLHEHGTAHEPGDLEAEDGDGRARRVLQPVAPHDPRRRAADRPCGADVVGVELVDERGAQLTHDGGGDAHAERDRGERDVTQPLRR